MISCHCDYDGPEFCVVEIRRARKRHACYECRGPILPGEQYEHTRGKWEGYMDSFRTCERCHDIRMWVQNNLHCFCWAYGNVEDDAKEAVADAVLRAPDETVGLRFGLLRRIVMRNKLNQERRTSA